MHQIGSYFQVNDLFTQHFKAKMLLSNSQEVLRDFPPVFDRGSPPAPLDKLPNPPLNGEIASQMSNKSFKDTLLRGHVTSMSMKLEDWVTQNKVKVDFLDKNCTIPKVTLFEETLHFLSRPWERLLVVKLLGKSIRYHMLYRRIQALWKPRGELDVLDLSHCFFFFFVRFHAQEDLDEVIFNGPWVIQHHYLTVKKWQPDFIPSLASVNSILAWVRLLWFIMMTMPCVQFFLSLES